MSNDLVQVSNDGGSAAATDSRDPDGRPWDLPPEEMGYGPRAPQAGPVHDARSEAGARQAERDAAQAGVRGDGTFQEIRSADAADLRQKRWDWGDARTWLWLVGMCAVFLAMLALCYFLPYGRHASPPAIRVY